ncbi:MAG: hypothetical protein V1833_01740 [Elusimicrobiota bacterium]
MKYKALNCLIVVCLVLNSSCATGLLKVKHLKNYDYSLLQNVSYTPTDINHTIAKIQTLREQIQRYNTELTDKDYDDIIKELTPIVEEYKKYSSIVNVTNKDNGTIIIPPKTRLTLKLNTYCLSSQKAAPGDDEPYILTSTNKVPDIPLYSEMMRYTNTKEKVNQHLKQNVIWNLQNKVKFEDLPREQRELLLKVDKNAYLKVNNYFKEIAKKGLGKLIDKHLPPKVDKVKEAIEIIKGKVYDYQEYAKRIERLSSKYKKPDNDRPVKAEGYEIYTSVKTNGYSNATVTFINTTDNSVEINSYFEPLRKDIQPLGFDLPSTDEVIYGIRQSFGELLSASMILLKNQLLKQGYKQYDFELKDGDRLTIEQNPEKLINLYRAFKCSGIAGEYTIKKFGCNKDGDISDAFRHAFWNAIMIRDIDDDFAIEFVNNHELNENEPDKNRMDFWNNKVGREIGKGLKEKGIFDNNIYAEEIIKNKERLDILIK